MMSSQTIMCAALVVMCLQPAVQGQRRYYNSYYNYGRSLGDNVDIVSETMCKGITCGINAQCTMSAIRPVCSCLPGCSGDPLIQCIRAECLDHTECRRSQACQNNHCINPCEGACGANANCDVVNHLPVCCCSPHYTGDPFTGCRIFDPEEACHPSPCGSNTKCHVANDVPVCSCLPGYKGSAVTGCRHECESDSECNYQQVCSNFKCNSACNDCGVNAECETVVNHRAVCKCPTGYIGDPYRNCQPECTGHSECPSYKPACYHNKCTDPCKGFCGTNADCNLRGLTPVCSCPRNMRGDPYSYCRPFEAKEACHPSPCGSNTKCHVANNAVICSCLPGYEGSGINGCRHECESDSECNNRQVCSNFKCNSACNECGVNAECETVVNHRAVCKCPTGYIGDPYRNCHPECTGHSECPSYKPACYYNKCTDPCKGSCGTNADCNLRGLTPVCSCPRNMTGDPFSYCRPFEARDLCEPNPCGLNTQCIPGHDRTGKERPVCNCLPGYVGNALVSCQRGECQLDAECPDHKACVGYACVDPCIGQCASTAQCNARRHIAVCTCPGRTQGDALVSCREPIDVPAGRSLRYY